MKFKLTYSPVDNWSVRPPQSKSYAQRALLIASLAGGKSRVIIRDKPDDVHAMINALKSFGVKVKGNTVQGSTPSNPGKVISCGESGATMRFLTSYSTLVNRGYVVLTGKGRLLKRPIKPLIDAILGLGGWAATIKDDGYPPVIVRASRMNGGNVTISSSDSSQYVSSLLMVSPYSKRATSIRVENLVSRPYVDMTMFVMKKFGVEVMRDENTYNVQSAAYVPAEFEPPADASSAMFFVSLAILSGRRITINGINDKAPQPDLSSMFEVMKRLQVPYRAGNDYVTIDQTKIRGQLSIDLKDSPDSLPPLAVLGLKISLRITGIRHARVKESDRVSAMATELAKLGASVDEKDDEISVKPPEKLRKGVKLNGWNDHRVVMAMAIADAGLELNSIIDGYEHVSKSYPGFFDDMATLGYRVIKYE